MGVPSCLSCKAATKDTADVSAGRLDERANDALSEHPAGKSRPI
jgi:hypothetical protein